MPADQQDALTRDLEARAGTRPTVEPANRPAGSAGAPPGDGP
jgi:hypothetical protein